MSNLVESGASCRTGPPFEMVDLPKIGDSRGNLTFVEAGRQVPFAINRCYYIYDVPGGGERGGHAHRELEQLLIAVSGSFRVKLVTARGATEVVLNRPYEGLLIRQMVWREMDDFSSGAVGLCIASTLYDEADYIRDYDEFVCLASKELQ